MVEHNGLEKEEAKSNGNEPVFGPFYFIKDIVKDKETLFHVNISEMKRSI